MFDKRYKNILLVFGYVAILYLAYAFLTHGLVALQRSPTFISLMVGIGIPFNVANWLVLLIGIVDLLVVVDYLV